MTRLVAPLLAFSATLLLLLVFAPALVPNIYILQQYDFWGVVMLLQLLLATPMLLLELALAKRSQSSPLKGIMQLTREADVSPRWRGLAWGGAVLVAILASVLLFNSSQLLQRELQLQAAIQLQPLWIYASLAVLSLGLSIAPRMVLVILSAVFVLAVVISVLIIPMGMAQVWQFTAFTGAEWGSALALVAISSLLGTGIFWQLCSQSIKKTSTTQLSHLSFLSPVVVMQLLAIVLAALTLGAADAFATSTVPLVALIIALIVLAALFWQLLLQQLQQREASLLMRGLIVLLPIILLSQLPFALATKIAVLLALILCAGYAIFVGWKMKISHLRKALNVQHEALYNLWRIGVRILVPLMVLSAILIVMMNLPMVWH